MQQINEHLAAAIGFAGLLTFTPSIVGAETMNVDSVGEEIIQIERELIDAYVHHRNPDSIANGMIDEFNHTDVFGGSTDKRQQVAFYLDGRLRVDAAAIRDTDVRVYDEVAILLATIDWQGASFKPSSTDDTIVDLSGSYRITRVYARRNGRWLMAASHASRISMPTGNE